MKKLICIFLIISLTLVGCIDIFESISTSKDNVNIMMNIILPKATTEMVNEMNDEKLDYKKIFSEKEIKKQFPKSAKVKSIDTEFDIGISVSASIKKSDLENIKEDYFGIPKKTSSGYTIPIWLQSISEEELLNNEDMNMEMVVTMFSTYKYKLLISKSFIGSIKSAEVVALKNSSKISFYDTGDAYLIDIPLSFLMIENTYLKIN